VLRRLIKDRTDLNFVVIYTREPHARQMAFKDIAQPANWEERKALADKAKKELELDALFLIDEMGDPSRALFGDIPNPAILVELDGTVKDKLAWADASVLRDLLKNWRPLLPKKPDAPPSPPTIKPIPAPNSPLPESPKKTAHPVSPPPPPIRKPKSLP
jgi:hypothetical protein